MTDADERQILQEAAGALVPEAIRPEAVRARFAGLRVLPARRGVTARARRETTITTGPSGMVTVAGGKLTTYRRIAGSVLDALRPQLGLRGLDSTAAPLPGAADPVSVAAMLGGVWPELDPALLGTFARTYGSLAAEVLSVDPDPFVAQVRYAFDREWAVTVDDVLRRRTTLGLRGLDTPELRARIDALFAHA